MMGSAMPSATTMMRTTTISSVWVKPSRGSVDRCHGSCMFLVIVKWDDNLEGAHQQNRRRDHPETQRERLGDLVRRVEQVEMEHVVGEMGQSDHEVRAGDH